MTGRWLLSALGLLLALAVGARGGGGGGSGFVPSQAPFTCNAQLVKPVPPPKSGAQAAAAASTAASAAAAAWRRRGESPGGWRQWRHRWGGGRGHGGGNGGQGCGWSQRRLHVELSFQGLTGYEQANAPTGRQLQPPDQALCVGNGVVMEVVNAAVRFYKERNGAPLGPPVALSVFMGINGTFTFDPRCQYDPASQRWFLTAGASELGVAVSVSNGPNPLRGWKHYNLNPQLFPTQFEDYPWLAVTPEAIIITTNVFNVSSDGESYVGAYVHALSKAALINGFPVVAGCYANTAAMPYPNGTIKGALYDTLIPAQQLAPYSQWQKPWAPIPLVATAADRNSDNTTQRLHVFSLRLPPGPYALASPNAAQLVSLTVQTVELPAKAAYKVPPPSTQPSTLVPPLGYTVYNTTVVNKLDSLDSRMHAVVAQGPRLFASWGSAVTAGGSAYAGAAWAVLDLGPSGLARVADAGLVRLKGGNLLMPSIAVAKGGRFGAIAVSASDNATVFPSAAYVPLTIAPSGRAVAGDVVLVGRGVGPNDGATGYVDANGVARFGDYSASTVDASNPCNIWIANEYIAQYCTPAQFLATNKTCGGTRMSGSNWSTRVTKLRAPGCH